MSVEFTKSDKNAREWQIFRIVLTFVSAGFSHSAALNSSMSDGDMASEACCSGSVSNVMDTQREELDTLVVRAMEGIHSGDTKVQDMN